SETSNTRGTTTTACITLSRSFCVMSTIGTFFSADCPGGDTPAFGRSSAPAEVLTPVEFTVRVPDQANADLRDIVAEEVVFVRLVCHPGSNDLGWRLVVPGDVLPDRPPVGISVGGEPIAEIPIEQVVQRILLCGHEVRVFLRRDRQLIVAHQL